MWHLPGFAGVNARATAGRAARLSLVTVCLALGACGGSRGRAGEPAPSALPPAFDPATGDTVAATAVGVFGRPLGAAVRVRFRPAGSLLIARRRGGTVEERVLDGVREVSGRLRASRADTLFLSVAAVSDASGRHVFPSGEGELWWARIQRAPDVRVDLLSRNPRRTEYVTNTIVIGAVWAGLGFSIWCLVSRCGD